MSHVDAWDRNRSSRIFALAGMSVLHALAQQVITTATRVEILKVPTPSLVMMEVGDPVSGGSFYAGEVLVTSCQVRVDGHLGYSTTLGDDEERTHVTALLDAALQNPASAPALWEQLAEEEQRIEQAHRVENALAARTRVHFETMEDRDTGNDLRSRI